MFLYILFADLNFPLLSTKRTIISKLNTMNTKNKKTMTFDGGNPDPGLGHAHKMSKVYDTCYLIGLNYRSFQFHL
jgi:hypothetical protein